MHQTPETLSAPDTPQSITAAASSSSFFHMVPEVSPITEFAPEFPHVVLFIEHVNLHPMQTRSKKWYGQAKSFCRSSW